MRPFISPLRGCLFALVGLLTAAAGASGEDKAIRGKAEKKKSVPLKAIVVEYMRAARWDHFDDGSFAVSDATVLKIISPRKHIGKLVIHHGIPAEAKSPWRAVGATLQFSMDLEWLQAKNVDVGSGAAENLKVLETPCDDDRERSARPPKSDNRSKESCPIVKRCFSRLKRPREIALWLRIRQTGGE